MNKVSTLSQMKREIVKFFHPLQVERLFSGVWFNIVLTSRTYNNIIGISQSCVTWSTIKNYKFTRGGVLFTRNVLYGKDENVGLKLLFQNDTNCYQKYDDFQDRVRGIV